MVELISLKGVSKESKIRLLRELGYDSDGKYVTKDGKVVRDEYVQKDVTVENMMILPGSAVVLDDNVLSLICYAEEYGDIF